MTSTVSLPPSVLLYKIFATFKSPCTIRRACNCCITSPIFCNKVKACFSCSSRRQFIAECSSCSSRSRVMSKSNNVMLYLCLILSFSYQEIISIYLPSLIYSTTEVESFDNAIAPFSILDLITASFIYSSQGRNCSTIIVTFPCLARSYNRSSWFFFNFT